DVVGLGGLFDCFAAQTNSADQDGVGANGQGELDKLVTGVELFGANFNSDDLVGGGDLGDRRARDILVRASGGFGFAKLGVHGAGRSHRAHLQDEQEATVF